MLSISKQTTGTDRVIYEAGTISDTNLKFTIYVDKKGSLCCAAHLDGLSPLMVEVKDFTTSVFFETFIFLLCELCMQQKTMTLMMRLNNRLVGSDEAKFQGEKPILERQVIGGSLRGEQCASFQAREIVLSSSCLTTTQRKELAEYMWFEWKN